jgi:hypothetical protein
METTEYFKQQINNNEIFKNLENDTGVIFLENSTDYKINKAVETINQQLEEVTQPKSELFLLAHLLYRTGYMKLPQPLTIRAIINSDDDINLKQYSRFTDGENIFLLANSRQIQADTDVECEFSCMERYTKEITIDNGNLFFYIPLNITYREIAKVEILKDNKALKYSQNFIDFDSEYSYEINSDGYMQVVILLNNEKANNLKLDDKLTINYFVLNDRVKLPDGLSIIETGYNIIVKDIQPLTPLYKGLTLQDMSNIVKYGRANIGDLCINEDYYQFIMKNIKNILVLKVWQEQEEAKEVQTDISNINKVFLCYVTNDGLIRDTLIDEKITNLIQTQIYGKEVIIRDTNIYDLTLTIIIETKALYDSSIKSDILAYNIVYFDDLKNKINQELIYGTIFKLLDKKLNEQPFILQIHLSDKGDARNNKIYRLLNENIQIIINGVLM